MSRTGKVHFVSSARLLRRQCVAQFGYRPRRQPRKPRTTKGRYRWLSPIEQLRIRADAGRGISAQRIAQRIGRDRRTIDRLLSDAHGVRLVLRLARHPALWVFVPDAIASLRGGEELSPAVCSELVGWLGLWRSFSSERTWQVMWNRLQAALRQLEERSPQPTAAAVQWGPRYAQRVPRSPIAI